MRMVLLLLLLLMLQAVGMGMLCKTREEYPRRPSLFSAHVELDRILVTIIFFPTFRSSFTVIFDVSVTLITLITLFTLW